ncbi:MAG: hypothetical protein ACYDC9_02440, partial [Dermatophilaceae bacterium]
APVMLRRSGRNHYTKRLRKNARPPPAPNRASAPTPRPMLVPPLPISPDISSDYAVIPVAPAAAP